MNVSFFKLDIVVILGVVGLIVLVSLVSKSGRKREQSSHSGMILTLVFSALAAALLAGLLIPAARIERSGATSTTLVMDSESRWTTSAPTNVAPADITPAGSDTAGSRVRTSSGSDPTRHREVLRDSVGLARPFFIGLSLAALIVLARVAADGRKNGGYTAPARIIAVMGFVGICALLAKIGPILH
ncbi:MAG TPA: hypothetical protein P5081_07730 [Phycisphaerae bacterium]|nr:hypothetical protein [Phycisphaerae bacterium]HRW52761.1 hypothetical protein [Phycisphaerae bacterium]